MDRILTFFSRNWRVMLVGLFLVVTMYVLLFRGLSTLTGGYAQTEIASRTSANSLRAIYENPANAPYKLLVWTGLKLDHHGLIVTRVAAAFLAMGMAALFYWVALHWYSKRIALLATILFVTSSGFLHFGRYGTGLILQMSTLAVIGSVFLYLRSRRETLMAYAIVALLSICLYIPGFIWFELIGLIVIRKQIARMIQKAGKLHTGLMLAGGLAIIAPLIWVGVHHLNVLRVLAGFPPELLSPSELLRNTLHLGSSVIWRGYWPPEYSLYGAPLLNVAEVILLIAGLLMLVRKPVLRQNYFLMGALIIASVLIVLGGSVTMAMLVPLLYLVIAGGLFYLLDQWLTVFPRNPVAQTTGFVFVFILAAFSAFYHLQAYYSAWPHAPETKQVYTIKPGS